MHVSLRTTYLVLRVREAAVPLMIQGERYLTSFVHAVRTDEELMLNFNKNLEEMTEIDSRSQITRMNNTVRLV